jgi:hypothetical protein
LRAHWLDLAIVVLTIPTLGKALAWLRLARFIRLARFGVIISRALQAERRLTAGDTLRVAAILTATAICLSGAAQYAFASGEFLTLSGTASGGRSQPSPPSATATSTRPPSRDESSE